MHNIILYSTNCPKCKILKQQLNDANIAYQENTNKDEMINHGFTTVPILSVDENLMQFNDAMAWVNQKGDKF